MTKRDRVSLAQLLTEVAERLESAPEKSSRAADDLVTNAGPSGLDHGAYVKAVFQAATLEHSCRDSATAIRFYVAEYLTPKPAKPRGRR